MMNDRSLVPYRLFVTRVVEELKVIERDVHSDPYLERSKASQIESGVLSAREILEGLLFHLAPQKP